ncbi:hypothetical protein SAMN05661044_01944 [Olivibacter domesticus]|uniref:Uncharacterized protein n=1 Tax=Olivibacter domesticus TaxID=407022 RepID=A0A1H7MBK7_OLID1|nr:hypothetical protein SAMN05661044_01944 [Olivibacter domesticus]
MNANINEIYLNSGMRAKSKDGSHLNSNADNCLIGLITFDIKDLLNCLV